jgi:hypothetical protein
MKWLITIKLTLLFTSSLIGQDSLNFDLLKLEEQIFYAQNDSIKNDFYLEKFNFSICNNLGKEKLLFELNRVQEGLLIDSNERANYLWNAAIVTKLNEEFTYSNMYFDAYLKETQDTSNDIKILGLVIKSEIDSATYSSFYNEYIHDSAFKCMDCLRGLTNYVLPNKRAYVMASTLLPGLGTMLTGDVYNGFGSLVLVPGSVIGVFQLWNGGLYINAVTWGYALIPRLYLGNTSLTSHKVELLEKRKLNKLADECKSLYGNKLILFPILYRL